MKASDYIIRQLHAYGVSHVFELSGGMITHLLDSICRLGLLEAVSLRHEQAAAFAADAFGRLSGIPGVAMATSGPGATNLLTGIASCYFDSTPAVFITGQVNTDELKGDRGIRQLGFQETDILAIARPITKRTFFIERPEDIPITLSEAFSIATENRPGPVLIDIPMNIQRADITDNGLTHSFSDNSSQNTASTDILNLITALKRAKRPLILAGGGIRASGARHLFRELADSLPIPIVHSLMGIDLLPHGHPGRIGMIGSYGNRWANLAVSHSDLLIVLGSRLDIRQTGSRIDRFTAGRVIYHVDCDPAEVNNRITGCIPIYANLKSFIHDLLDSIREHSLPFQEYCHWLNEISALRDRYSDMSELIGLTGINPNRLMHLVSEVSQDAGAYVVDVGQHQMWAAQSLQLVDGQAFLTSGGLGSMGYALPASIGAWCAVKRPIVVIAGDGGMQCNIQELQTIVHHKVPVKIIVVNNACHGMVRQFQEAYFDGRYQSTLEGYSAPAFASVAKAYGLPSNSVRDPDELEASLRWLWKEPERPALLEVVIDTYANAYPKIRFGCGIDEMEPVRD